MKIRIGPGGHRHCLSQAQSPLRVELIVPDAFKNAIALAKLSMDDFEGIKEAETRKNKGNEEMAAPTAEQIHDAAVKHAKDTQTNSPDFVKYYDGAFCEAGNLGRESKIVSGLWHPRVTWFKQLTDNWEKQNKHKGDYSDGDPGISFVIKTYADYSLKDSVKTEMFKLEDVGTWTGHQYFTKEFSGGADEIYICPRVVERNMIELNVDHTSYYCYIIEDAGKNVNKPIDQSDYMASDFELEWTVRISYN